MTTVNQLSQFELIEEVAIARGLSHLAIHLTGGTAINN